MTKSKQYEELQKLPDGAGRNLCKNTHTNTHVRTHMRTAPL